MPKTWHRRQVLAGLGAMAVASPFVLNSMARAAAPGKSKRLVVFFTPNGTIPSKLGTSGAGTNFELATGSIMEPLNPLKSQLTILRGLEFKNATNHEGGMRAMLTGNGTASSPSRGMSVDQYVASQLGSQTRFNSLEFGVQTSAWGANVQTRMSYASPDQYAAPDDDPASVYRRLFGDTTGGEMAVDRRLARRMSILDVSRDELKQLQTKLGASERQKLEQHLESIRVVEKRLGGSASMATGGTCDKPTPVMALSTQDNDSFPAIGKVQMDLLVTALACGHTNIASIQWSHTVANTVFSWLNVADGHHDLSHYDNSNAARVEAFVKAERWYAEQFVYLLNELEKRPEPQGEGSLLDNTLVVWAQELGDGRNHVCTDVPWVLAGGAGGALKRGQLIDAKGASHQQVLVAICQMMGLDMQIFGDPAHGAGALSGLLA